MNTTRRVFLKSIGACSAALPLPAVAFRAAAADAAAAGPLVKSVRDLGIQFRDNPLRITGQDGATSTQLPNGDALWLFGDTVEGPFQTIRNLDLTNVLSNTACIVPAQDVTGGIKQFEFLKSADGRRPRQVIEFDPQDDKAVHRLWPIHSVAVGDKIYAFYHKITMDPDVDVFETFELDGMGIARAKVGEYRFERLRAPDGSLEFWKGEQPGFGVFVEELPDGYLYLWGCFWTGMFLARTRPDRIEDLTQYEYLVDGPTAADPARTPVWKPTFEPSFVLFDHVPNELSVAYNPYLQRHIAIHVYDRENKLAIRTAPSVVGPWSKPEIFFRPPIAGKDDLFTAGKEHLELRDQNGKILYITYVNSAVYAPRLLEVALS